MIIDYLNKQYNVKVCEKKEDNHNYFTIDKITKCSTECMTVIGTLYIYCCNYEDLLRKVETIPPNTQVAINNNEDDVIELQVTFNMKIPIDTTTGAGTVKIVEVDINDKEIHEIISLDK